MTETQPPPPAARLALSFTPISPRSAALRLKWLSMRLNDGASTAPMAPPHAEHAVEVFEQVAVLFSNKDDATVRVLEMVPMAPPVCAVLLVKEQLLTSTVLCTADIAPPVPLKASKLTQF
jgi:hypothetical protein